uniref:PIPO n=1 Tax=Onion yellow dwarf virus TaxID=43130 RepID=A0A6M2YZ47_9POTV|nr:PIPO [Onion yellow dwarf virus]QED45317.1 PIPO [Onion yellow dwarf virus]
MLRRDLSGIMARTKFIGKMCIRMGKAKVRATFLKNFQRERFEHAKRQCEELFETMFKVHCVGSESASFRFLFHD